MVGSTPDLLRIRDLRITIGLQRGSIEVVKGVSFRIPRGKTVALVGESGSGKSIIAQSILGILPRVATIEAGQILFSDPAQDGPAVDIAELPVESRQMQALRGGRISMIFQEPMTSLSPIHRIGDQVEEALVLHRKIDKGMARSMTEDMLKLVGFPDPSRAYDMYSMELSGGLRQRAMIAMALICHPALLIADEPTTALDVTIQAQVLGLLKELQQKLDMSLLLITHDLGVVANMADEVVVIYHGEILEAGSLKDIYRKPGHAYTKALMRAVPRLAMEPGEILVALREVDQKIPDSMRAAGRDLAASSTPLLSLKHMTKSYPIGQSSRFLPGSRERFLAVNDVSFDIMRGECFGVVGESGCGKSTLSKLIMHAIPADQGEILFDNGKFRCSVLDLSGKELKEFRKRIQIVFQDPFSSLSPRSTVLNILREPLEIHQFGSASDMRQMASELMALVGLQPTYLNRYPHSFSGGQRQRIGIARALSLNPDLLICDEPVSALDVSVQAQILNLLKKLQAELGLTMMFISHNLAVVKYIADRIAVMRRGRIVEIASTAMLFDNPVHPYTQELLEAVPHADLDHQLDFTHTGDELHDPEERWDPVFKGEVSQLELQQIDDGHFVLAKDTIVNRRLSA